MRQIARRADIRDLILDAVDVLLAKFGYGKMTMEDVARQVGIGKGTIYLHFPSKEELVLAHIDRIGETVVRKLRELAVSSDPAERKLRRMLVLRVLHRFDSVAHYTQSLGDLLSSVRAPLLVRRQATFEKEAAVFEDVLREGGGSAPWIVPTLARLRSSSSTARARSCPSTSRPESSAGGKSWRTRSAASPTC